MRSILRYLVNYFLAVDQLCNTLLFGHPDETISSRLGRSKGRERYFFIAPLRKLVDFLFFFDKTLDGENIIHHCEKSIMPLEQENFRTMTDYEIWSWNKQK